MQVTVYESQQDISQNDLESYPIGINPRGMRTLKMVNPAMEQAIDVATGMVAAWSIMAPTKQIARSKSGTVLGTTRGAVVAEPRSSCRRAGVMAGGALWLAKEPPAGAAAAAAAGRAAGRVKDRSAMLRDFPTWLPLG